MKKLVIIAFLFPFQLFAQNLLPNNLLGEWIKTDIRMRDGSAIYTPSLKESVIRYIFQPNNTALIIYNGKTSKTTYQLHGNRLSFGNDNAFNVEKLTETQLILGEDSTLAQPVKIIMEPARFQHLGFVPATYITQGNDTIYVAQRNKIEPFFLDTKQNVMEFIYANFDFPANKKGNFSVRFIITDKGELKAIKVLESNQEKYNDKLINAIKKTKNKWLPATWEGKKVNTEMQLFFDMTPPPQASDTPTTSEGKSELSNEYFSAGTSYFEAKNYRQALEYFNKSIEIDSYNVNAYYNRAACFLVLKQKDSACKDLQTLKDLEQKKGIELHKKYCE